jgi:putative ABC transport system substrate-binding protein
MLLLRHTKRRTFIAVLGSAAAWPVVARAQQAAVPVVGFLNSGWPDVDARAVRAFHHGLSETGYVAGQNVAIEYRWAGGQTERLPALAADLVRRRVAAIAATGAAASALAAKAATATIPIVFYYGADPVGAGLIASLNRPGDNLTGVSALSGELGPKRLELLHELVPSARVIAMLVSPLNPNAESPLGAARSLGLQIHFLPTRTERDFDESLAKLSDLRANGLWIGAYGVFVSRSEELAARALRHSMPAISPSREFAAAGGLMSYGGSNADQYRLVGVYIGRVLKGEKPADLPVQQSTRFELVINLKTARALGLTIPETLLATADEVIQ